MCGCYREKLHVSHLWELKGLLDDKKSAHEKVNNFFKGTVDYWRKDDTRICSALSIIWNSSSHILPYETVNT